MIGVIPPAITPHLANADRLFRTLARDRLAALETAQARLAKGETPRDAMVEIGGVAHKIAGTASTLGHDRLGFLAAEVERLVALGATQDEITPTLSGLMEALEKLSQT